MVCPSNPDKITSGSGAYYVQKVEAYHSRFKLWLDGFHGVVAHSLPHHLGWRRVFEHPHSPMAAKCYLRKFSTINGDIALNDDEVIVGDRQIHTQGGDLDGDPGTIAVSVIKQGTGGFVVNDEIIIIGRRRADF